MQPCADLCWRLDISLLDFTHYFHNWLWDCGSPWAWSDCPVEIIAWSWHHCGKTLLKVSQYLNHLPNSFQDWYCRWIACVFIYSPERFHEMFNNASLSSNVICMQNTNACCHVELAKHQTLLLHYGKGVSEMLWHFVVMAVILNNNSNAWFYFYKINTWRWLLNNVLIKK